MLKVIKTIGMFLTLPWATVCAAQIVNINANINDIPNPVFILLDGGTYNVTPIGTADGGVYDAMSNWSFTTCTQEAGCELTTPTTFTGWRSAYDVISPDINSVSIDGTLLTPIDTIPSGVGFFSDFFLMDNATVRYHADDQMVYPDALTALLTARTSTFTLSTSGLVGFSITDIRPLADNRGGVSLQVSAVTPPIPTTSANPIPAVNLFFVSALLGIAGIRRLWTRRKS